MNEHFSQLPYISTACVSFDHDLSDTPWGLLPLLEYEGNIIGQSATIARFVAKEHGLSQQSTLIAFLNLFVLLNKPS